MEIRIKLNKQMLATAKLAAIVSMPDETETINKYMGEDSEEVIDFDLSLLEEEQRQQMAVMLGFFVIAQKAKKVSSQVLILEQDWELYHTFTCFMNNGTGMVSVSNYPDTKETYIHGLYVKDIFRRCGNATLLLNEAEKYADYPIIVWVNEDAEEWLVKLYEKRGYVVKKATE